MTLADGTTLWLGDMPMLDQSKAIPYTSDPCFSFAYGGKPSSELLAT